jgi:uncharacterized protein (TIGR02996 family)
MSDEEALLAAIIGHPGEDTPRLAYADWLDENEAPIQANFVRTQCALASCSAADPEYPDHVERYAELVARFGPIASMTVPKLPPGFEFDDELNLDTDNFRRGFLYTVHGTWDDDYEWASDEQIDSFCAGLPKLIETTTARQLRLENPTAEHLARVLSAPGAEALTGLTITPDDWGDAAGGSAVRAIAAAKAVPNLERLSLYMHTTASEVARLARAKFVRLVHFELPTLSGRARDLRPLLEAKWFRGLRSVRAGASDRPIESALLTALAELPHLESLDLGFPNPTAMSALSTTRGFRSLARLTFAFALGRSAAAQLAKGTFPRLAELELWNVSGPQLDTILKARWISQLRVLTLRRGTLNEKSVVALSKSPAAANLRILRLEDIAVGKKALPALGDGARFPNLTTLDLGSFGIRRTAADAVQFAKELSLPRIRHLTLNGWPLGDRGAKALAANPALANLTRLLLARCGIGETGLTALVRSPHLQQLVELDVSNNKLKTAAALRDTKWLPRLAAVQIHSNAIPSAAHRRLHAVRGLVV